MSVQRTEFHKLYTLNNAKLVEMPLKSNIQLWTVIKNSVAFFVTTNNTTNNNDVFFSVSDLKILYYNSH